MLNGGRIGRRKCRRLRREKKGGTHASEPQVDGQLPGVEVYY